MPLPIIIWLYPVAFFPTPTLLHSPFLPWLFFCNGISSMEKAKCHRLLCSLDLLLMSICLFSLINWCVQRDMFLSLSLLLVQVAPFGISEPFEKQKPEAEELVTSSQKQPSSEVSESFLHSNSLRPPLCMK